MKRTWICESCRAWIVLLLAGAVAPACTPCRRTLTGFPLYTTATGATGIGDAVRAVAGDLERIDQAIAGDEGPVGKPGATPDEGATGLRTAALEALFEAQLMLAAEYISTKDPPQLDVPPYPPLLLYPRLTAPAIVEPRPVVLPGGARETWIVPLVFDKDAFFWDLSPEAVWLGRSPRRSLHNDPTGNVSGWIVPHGEMDLAERKPVALAPYLVYPEPLEVSLSTGKRLSLPDVESSRAGLALALPVRGADGSGFDPGYYNLQILPRIRNVHGLTTPWGRRAGALLDVGDWYGFRALVARFGGAEREGGAAAIEQDLLLLAAGVDDFIPTRFDRYLDAVHAALLHWAWRMPDPQHRCAGAFPGLLRALDIMLLRPHQPVPVLLDEPGGQDEPFSFIASGDLQFGTDRTHLFRFLRLIGAYGNADEVASSPYLSAEVRARLAHLKFVVITGDLGDGEGFSSSPHTAIVAGFGLLPPLSPYATEFPLVRGELERSRIPIIAVPGNHDGFANYGGVVNHAFDWAGQILKVPPDPIRLFTHPVGHGLQEVGRRLPSLLKVGRLARHPYYDGLVQWVYDFGPLNVSFGYRGCSFVALNSYNLPQLYRDQIGPIANNWGGCVEPADVLWFRTVLGRNLAQQEAARHGPGLGFVFMHHDPRAAIPDPEHTGKEIGFAHYDDADTPFNAITFGWAGINYSAINPVFVPVVTPIGSNVTRLLTTKNRFDQEWMGPTWVSDEDCHGARALVEGINEHLEGPGDQAGGIHQIFYGHNDDVAEGLWASPEHDGHVFRPDDGQRWTGYPYASRTNLRPFFKLRSTEPFDWGREMRIQDGSNAHVTRMDDLGDNGSDDHGFHLVTVYPRPGKKPIVVSTHVPIPSAAPAELPPPARAGGETRYR